MRQALNPCTSLADLGTREAFFLPLKWFFVSAPSIEADKLYDKLGAIYGLGPHFELQPPL